ncbi:phosphoglucosamine mutase [Anaerotardibacter muris]|uniref:phosphoglucosamine mutase n=1 Tax=Anaerotardibacter muris TaxID=2941505 RepID=UPI00204086DA|nr:phosphoglucosamine mutase [Anaerotardibacter muris]
MTVLFGTDGVRGVANTELTCDTAFKLGQAAGAFLGKTIVVGKDTRLSGDMLGSALAAGIMSTGATVLDAGIIPTPGVAYLVRELHADGGIVISASHNPPEYNGIKFFDGQGFKLTEAEEDEIEKFVLDGGMPAGELPSGDEVGVTVPVENACDLYIQHAISSLQDKTLDFSNLVIALDTGHGAASLTTAAALEQLGATVHVINDDFSGVDINVECGSTHLEPVKALVDETGAMIGIAHDGDADRVMFVDELGNEIDGDVVETVCALDLQKRGLLRDNLVVSTVMCNLGFTKAMDAAGITVVQTSVGDKYVLNEMRQRNAVIGGEQSGHMIFLDHNSTGDGLITALQFLAACLRNNKPVSETAKLMQRFPQELINVRVTDKNEVMESATVAEAIQQAEAKLAGSGRVLVRPSGTEPLVRVMVEAATPEEALSYAQEIVDVIEQELGA